jgi:hypothetical protein
VRIVRICIRVKSKECSSINVAYYITRKNSVTFIRKCTENKKAVRIYFFAYVLRLQSSGCDAMSFGRCRSQRFLIAIYFVFGIYCGVSFVI